MEGRELHADNKRLQSFPKLPVWIIEHVWAHKMMDVHQVVDPSHWPDVDSQPLNLEDTWRLRVASAQVYSIVKKRDVENFERVLGFLESTYRLLPGLVAPIKHMKILFGLKTMVIMWMLRVGKGKVDTVFKVIKFFPSKLPQYQDQCSQHDMFLMRKNHLDFKALAVALATDKNKLEDYMKKHVEEQYGEHYAQKVEDRLLHYLHKLETVLPEETYIDKILKKSSPVTEEEQLLLEVVTRDSMSIAATLNKLLHCDFASCRQTRLSQSSENGENDIESSVLSKSAQCGRSSKAVLKPVVSKAQLDVFRRTKEAANKVSKDGTYIWGHQPTKLDGDIVKRVEEESSDKRKADVSQRRREPASSPHFCSKHRRWVKSILQECPDECSEELLLQANVSLSPLLFHSSSSTSSSQDLTPSDLIQCPPPSQTITQLQTAAPLAYGQTNPEDKCSPGSAGDTSQKDSLPLLSSHRDTPQTALLSPVVRLIDIAYVTSGFSTTKPYEKSPNHLTSANKQAASSSTPQVPTRPHCHSSENKDSVSSQPETVDLFKKQTAPPSTTCQPTAPRTYSRLSRKYRRTCINATNRHSQSSDGFSEQARNVPAIFHKSCPPLLDFVVSGPPTNGNSTSASPLVQSGTLSTICTANQIPAPIKSSHLDHLAIKLGTSQVEVQAALLQPYVSIIRLSSRECHRMTSRRCSARCGEPVSQGNNHKEIRTGDEEDANSSFDPNTLYSSHSSSSDSEDSTDHDPDYKPCIKKKRLLLEYEAARILNHI